MPVHNVRRLQGGRWIAQLVVLLSLVTTACAGPQALTAGSLEEAIGRGCPSGSIDGGAALGLVGQRKIDSYFVVGQAATNFQAVHDGVLKSASIAADPGIEFIESYVGFRSRVRPGALLPESNFPPSGTAHLDPSVPIRANLGAALYPMSMTRPTDEDFDPYMEPVRDVRVRRGDEFTVFYVIKFGKLGEHRLKGQTLTGMFDGEECTVISELEGEFEVVRNPRIESDELDLPIKAQLDEVLGPEHDRWPCVAEEIAPGELECIEPYTTVPPGY